MKKNERRMILLLIIIAIVVIVVLVNVKSDSKKDINTTNNIGTETNNEMIIDGGTGAEEFVEVLDDGKKLNISDKISETKTFGNYEISNIQLTEQDGQSQILGDVKNVGESKLDVTLIDITILDKDQNEIVTIGGIIGEIEPGGTVQLNASATADFANAYDITFKVSDEQ